MLDLSIGQKLDQNESWNTDKLHNKLYKVACYKIAFQNQPANQIVLAQASLSKPAIEEMIFEGNEAAVELYNIGKIAISLSLPTFKELFYFDEAQKNISYFQPRFILNGQSYCTHESPEYKMDITQLENAFKFQYQKQSIYERINHLQNSSFYESSLSLNFSKRKESVQKILALSQSLNINRLFKFQTNFMNCESIIQLGLDQDMIRPVRMIFEEIFDSKRNMELQQTLVQDLPQLMNQKRVDILKFLDISYDEVYREYVEIEDSNKVEFEQFNQNFVFCNLEMFLKSVFLPSLQRFPIHQDFNGLFQHKKFQIQNHFDTQREAENCLMNIDQDYEEDIKSYFWLSIWVRKALCFCFDYFKFNKRKNTKVVQVHHSVINFVPMVRKIKIDVFLERDSSTHTNTDYLRNYKSKCKCLSIKVRNIKNNQLLLSSLIACKSDRDDKESLEFYNQSTVKKIIDLQQPFAIQMNWVYMIVYIFLYCIPYFINLLFNQLYYKHHWLRGNQLNIQVMHSTMIIGTIVQLLITTTEAIEAYYDGLLSYFSNIYNIMQFLQFFAHIYYVTSNYIITHNFVPNLETRTDDQIPLESWLLGQRVIEVIILICIFIKVFEFMNARRKTRLITQMFIEVMYDVWPFLIVFFWLVLIMTFFSIVFDVRPCDDELSGFKCTGEDDDYLSLDKLSALFISTFRISIGDLQAPQYQGWVEMEDINPRTSMAAIWLIWIAWFINVVFTMIMMLNFLIAEVGATYNRVVSLGQKNHYRQASSVNKKYYLIFYFCRNRKMFRYDAIVFTTRMDQYQEGQDDQHKQSNVQTDIQNAIHGMNKKMNLNQKQIEIMNRKTNVLDQKFTKFLQQIGMYHEDDEKQGMDKKIN